MLVSKSKGQTRVAFYVRVSTTEQTTANQLDELQGVAERRDWNVVAVFEDAGISGAKGRDKRPGLDKLLRAVTRREVDYVAAWSVDRLGRSLHDLCATFEEIHAGADLYLHQQGIDTKTPAGKAMFHMLGVFAEFERAIIRERVNAGLARAKAQGKQLGRRRDDDKAEEIMRLRAQGIGVNKIARQLSCGVSMVQRVLAEAA
jgi:DNA invertase Pin-like site-specific DNA recombinase